MKVKQNDLTRVSGLGGDFVRSAIKDQAKQLSVENLSFDALETGRYNFDTAHGIVGFAVRHLGIALVRGIFKDFRGTVDFDADNRSNSSVEFSANIESLDTGNSVRDKHVKSKDFFDAEIYPEMSFQSASLDQFGIDWILTGDLTIKGITKQISFPFSMTGGISDPWGGTRFGIAAETTIDRREFGINFGNTLPSGALDIANDVLIELHFEVIKEESSEVQ